MRSARRSARPLLVVAGVLLLAVVGASVAAPWEFQGRDLPAWLTPPAFTMQELESVEPEEAIGGSEGEPRAVWDLGWVVALVQVAIAGLVVLVLRWLWLRFRYSQVAERVRQTGNGGTVPAGAEEPDLPVLVRGVSAARTLLDDERDPALAIVAAWLALEEAAASAGVTRIPSQTPTEFTLAVLDRTDADGDATRWLLDLYLRARFSGVPSVGADVEAARACLVTLAGSWRELASDEGEPR